MTSRVYNRLTVDQLEKGGDGVGSKVNQESAPQYKELKNRIQRHKQLKMVTQKMKTKKDLMVGTSLIPAKIIVHYRAKVIVSRWPAMGSIHQLIAGRKRDKSSYNYIVLVRVIFVMSFTSAFSIIEHGHINIKFSQVLNFVPQI